MRYEYDFDEAFISGYSSHTNFSDIKELLNTRGKKGWRYIDMFPAYGEDESPHKRYFLFEKEIKD